MIRNTQKIGIHGQIDVRWTHFDGDYPIFKFRVGDSRGRIILEGEDMGKGMKMPDASKVMNGLCLDLIVAGQSWSPEEPGDEFVGWISRDSAEWAHEALEDLQAVREALVPVMAREL
jgi:hypothetical protein